MSIFSLPFQRGMWRKENNKRKWEKEKRHNKSQLYESKSNEKSENVQIEKPFSGWKIMFPAPRLIRVAWMLPLLLLMLMLLLLLCRLDTNVQMFVYMKETKKNVDIFNEYQWPSPLTLKAQIVCTPGLGIILKTSQIIFKRSNTGASMRPNTRMSFTQTSNEKTLDRIMVWPFFFLFSF